MDRPQLEKAVEALNVFLNSNSFSKEVVEMEEVEDAVLVESFLSTIEKLPKGAQKKLKKDFPTVVEINNLLIDEAEQKADNKSTPPPESKKEEKAEKPKKPKEGKSMGRPKKEVSAKPKPTKEKKPTPAPEKKDTKKKSVSSGSFSSDTNVGKIYEFLKKPMTFPDLVELVKKKIGEKSANPSNVRVYLSQINAKGLLMRKDEKYFTK